MADEIVLAPFAIAPDARTYSCRPVSLTRTRIVLAFHAALLEGALARNGNHPVWLLFDVPKQHELSQKDFDSCTERLISVAQKYRNGVQVVFSVADWKTQLEVGDQFWTPEFTLDGGARFLGPM